MPMLMEKQDWARTVANVGSADRVWSENVFGHEGTLSFSIPENGMYQVILVKLEDAQDALAKPGRIKIGSMKDEIRLPANFDQEFEELDEQVGSFFAGATS